MSTETYRPVETIADAVQELADCGGRFSPNVSSGRIEDAKRILYAALAAHESDAVAAVRIHKGILVLIPRVGMGATQHFPSDAYPFEIVRVVSPLTIEVRAMRHEARPGMQPYTQDWIITPNEGAPVHRLRLRGNGTWHGKLGGSVSIGHASYHYCYEL